ncbi:MAG: PhoH family protein [Myxococcales bacterium FL481]|nr:MAG: PhoH family protein [Myxococcales bacterium FL481]
MLGSSPENRRAVADIRRETGIAIHVRGHDITLEGPADQQALVERLLSQMADLAASGRPLQAADVSRAIAVLRTDPAAKLAEVFRDEVVTRSSSGGANGSGGVAHGITPRSLAQKHYVDAMRKHSLTFGVGPAGTGKTFLAVAMAVRRLLDKQVRRVVLVRPAIEAGESLGFLPGTFEEKVDPYMRPLYDALHDALDGSKVQRMVEQGTIEIAPLAYMRGRTLNNAFVILDEAQNTTREQMKMFLTRIGTGTWAVVTGDPSQIDLPRGKSSGLSHALDILDGVAGIGIARFSQTDVMRHPLVQAIVRAYDRAEKGERRVPGERNGRGRHGVTRPSEPAPTSSPGPE